MGRAARVFCAFLLGGALLIGVAPDAAACTCLLGTPLCESFWKTPVVFSGEVLEVSPKTNLHGSQFVRERLVRFRVDRVWRGEVSGEIQVHTGGGGGDCGYNFQRGVRYLVYAHYDRGLVSTGICSRTRPLAEAGEDLAYLKTALQPSAAGRVFGRVTYQRTAISSSERPIPGYTVTLSNGQNERRTETDADGRYEFKDVPTGTYSVKVDLPDTEHAYGPQKVELVDPRGCAAADFSIASDGRISTRIVDDEGRAARGIRLELTPQTAPLTLTLTPPSSDRSAG